VILEPLKRRTWPKGYWKSWGKVPDDFEAPEPLPSGQRMWISTSELPLRYQHLCARHHDVGEFGRVSGITVEDWI
jgi:hypothetical protein